MIGNVSKEMTASLIVHVPQINFLQKVRRGPIVFLKSSQSNGRDRLTDISIVDQCINLFNAIEARHRIKKIWTSHRCLQSKQGEVVVQSLELVAIEVGMTYSRGDCTVVKGLASIVSICAKSRVGSHPRKVRMLGAVTGCE